MKQEEIAKVKGVELDQGNVGRRLGELPELVKCLKDSFAKKKSIAEIISKFSTELTDNEAKLRPSDYITVLRRVINEETQRRRLFPFP